MRRGYAARAAVDAGRGGPVTSYGRRVVDVAIDSAGPAGGRTYSYEVPRELGDIAPGEAVLVEFGRRQALGIVLAERPTDPDIETKPILARVRSDGPLLPPLQVELARFIAQHYLAPAAMVVRQLLPPGLLERVELVARAIDRPSESAIDDDVLAAVLAADAEGLAIDELPRQQSRATLLRRLRGLEKQGAVALEWRVRPPAAREKVERLISLTDAGREAASALAAGEPVIGRPLGERQRALLVELLAAEVPLAAPLVAERHGASAIPGLRKRELIEITESVVSREPLAGRPQPVRGALPDEAELTSVQRQLVERVAALARGG
jgi:primosomal protein N'